MSLDNGIKSQSYAAFARDLKAYLYTLQLMQEVRRAIAAFQHQLRALMC